MFQLPEYQNVFCHVTLMKNTNNILKNMSCYVTTPTSQIKSDVKLSTV